MLAYTTGLAMPRTRLAPASLMALELGFDGVDLKSIFLIV
jgi:hypothetical protein